MIAQFESAVRIPHFRPTGSGASSYVSRHEPLTLDQVRTIAPSVFAEEKHGSRSDRYAYIPTSEVLRQLEREGFRPYSVMQGGSRDEEKRGFTKHLLRLRHDSARPIQQGDHFNEIVLLNSHDGTSSYQLSAGVFRLACSNGLVVAESLIGQVRVPHKGDVGGQVLDGCIEILGKLPEVSEAVREMTALRLSDGERRAFAVAAHAARYDEPEEAPVTADRLLTARRTADSDSTLWHTLNVVQENVIRGGLSYIQRDQQNRPVARRKTREVRGIDQNTALNRALWTLAEEMRKLKTA